MKLIFFKLVWNFFKLTWTYFIVKWTYFKLNWTLFKIRWTYFKLGWTYFKLAWKRCSITINRGYGSLQEGQPEFCYTYINRKWPLHDPGKNITAKTDTLCPVCSKVSTRMFIINCPYCKNWCRVTCAMPNFTVA